ncbi:MAG TPA: hypothetical protein VGM73_02090 [Candidatus Didemnitutus sp.]|jgi:hypothetical protein
MGQPARPDANEAAAPDDAGTGLPALPTWRSVYAIVIALCALSIALLIALTVAYS